MENKKNKTQTSEKSTIRELPSAVDLEKAVLGAVLLEREAFEEIADFLQPMSFFYQPHRFIFEAVLALHQRHEAIDLLTLSNLLRKQKLIEQAGGLAYLANLTTVVNSAANIEHHARIVQEQAIKRAIIQTSDRAIFEAYEYSSDAFAVLDKLETNLTRLSETYIKRNYDSARAILAQSLKNLEAKIQNPALQMGISSGLKELDKLTGGWQNSDLIVIAARPGMGKTALVLKLLREASIENGLPTAIFSLEMSKVQLMNRLVAAEAEIENDRIQKGNLTIQELQDVLQKTARLAESPIFIDDSPALRLLELRAKARRLKNQQDVRMLVVDYLQLMAGDGKTGNREQEIATISRGLKQLAKELDIPVIALSQLSRAVETRGGDKKPQLSDLRESGSVEQDADNVIFIYRPEYYGLTEDAEGRPITGRAELIVAKQRNGALGSAWTEYVPQFTRFGNISVADMVGNPF